MELLLHVLEHSFWDTLRLVPFLLVTYLAMEALEHSAADRVQAVVERSGKAGPVVGALLGALPQCGFSAMAATLYAGRVVTVGTLVAVILSTSDEMVPVFLAHQEPAGRMLAIMAVKVVVGVVAGFAVDAFLRASRRSGDGHAHIHELCERAHCHCDDGDAHEDGHGGGHAHGHGRWAIVRSAAVHTAQVSAWILVITFAFGLVIELVGTEALAALLAVVVVGGAAVLITHPWDPTATQTKATTPADTSMSGFPGILESLTGQDVRGGSDGEGAEQLDAFSVLESSYESLSALSERVDASEESLRDVGVSGDDDARSKGLSDAQAISLEVSNLISQVGMLDDGGGAYSDDISNVITLGNWLRNRCDALTEAWQRSVDAEDPAASASSILAPVEGSSDYARLFSENYDAWKPEQAS